MQLLDRSFFVYFSGGSEDGSPRNKKPPAMPVRLSVFRFKQINYPQRGMIDMVRQPIYHNEEVIYERQ